MCSYYFFLGYFGNTIIALPQTIFWEGQSFDTFSFFLKSITEHLYIPQICLRPVKTFFPMSICQKQLVIIVIITADWGSSTSRSKEETDSNPLKRKLAMKFLERGLKPKKYSWEVRSSQAYICRATFMSGTISQKYKFWFYLTLRIFANSWIKL